MSYVTERRLEEKERRRAEILDAAESVAGAVGIEAMTMDEVARTARLSRALLYVYFEDKSDLLFGLCDRALDTLHQRFVAAVARHRRGLEQIEACGRAYVAFSQEFPVYFEALARFEAHAPETSASAPTALNEQACMLRGGKVHAVMVECIERGVADGSIRPDVGPPILISITLWGFLHGIIQIAATKGQVLARHDLATQQLVEQALTLCSRALRPATPQPA
jgi:AcrR family transcriptional regulator